MKSDFDPDATTPPGRPLRPDGPANVYVLLPVGHGWAWLLGGLSLAAGIFTFSDLVSGWRTAVATCVLVVCALLGVATLWRPKAGGANADLGAILFFPLLLGSIPAAIALVRAAPWGPGASLVVAVPAVAILFLQWIVVAGHPTPGARNPLDLPVLAAAFLVLPALTPAIARGLRQDELLLLGALPFAAPVVAAAVVHPFAFLVVPGGIASAILMWQRLPEMGFSASVTILGAVVSPIVLAFLLRRLDDALGALGAWRPGTDSTSAESDVSVLADIMKPAEVRRQDWLARITDLDVAAQSDTLGPGHLRDFARLLGAFRAEVDAEKATLDGWVLESALLGGLVFAGGVQAATLDERFVPAFVLLMLTTLPFLCVVLLRHGLGVLFLEFDRELRYWEEQAGAAQLAGGTSSGRSDTDLQLGPGSLAWLRREWIAAGARRVRLSLCRYLRRLGLLMFFGGIALVLFPVTPLGGLSAALVLCVVFVAGEIRDVRIRRRFAHPVRETVGSTLSALQHIFAKASSREGVPDPEKS